MCILHLELAKRIKDARLWLARLGSPRTGRGTFADAELSQDGILREVQIANSNPEEILLECYWRGEVDRIQFILMLDDLRTQNPRKSR